MKLKRVFLDCDLRCSFDGLREVAKKAKTDLEGSTVLFLNRKSTGFKLITNNSYCVYYRSTKGRIPLDALRYLPVAFGGSEFEMTRAIEQSLMDKLGVKKGEAKWIRKSRTQSTGINSQTHTNSMNT